MSIWRWMVNVLSRPVVDSALWTLLVMLVATLVYRLVHGRLRGGDSPVSRRRHLRMIAVGLVLLSGVLICHIWGLPVLGSAATQTGVLIQNILWTAAAAAMVYLLVRAAQHAMLGSSVTIESRHKIRLTTSWVGIVVFVVAAGLIWASGVQDLGVFLGIIGAGLAMSMQETLLCIAGWLLLVIRRPYDIGDRVQIDGRIGDVIDISVFQTSMLEVGNWVHGDQSTGRMLIIPNSMVVRFAMYNYSKGFPFVWDEFSTIVTFESDWQAAREVMRQQAEQEAEKIADEVQQKIRLMQHRYAIHYEHLQPIVYTTIADNGVQLVLRYLSPVRQRRAFTTRISENVLNAFLDHPKIDFAYPTTRIFRNNEEGKPGAGGPDQPYHPTAIPREGKRVL